MTLTNCSGYGNLIANYRITKTLLSGQSLTVKNCLSHNGKVELGAFAIQANNSWGGGFSISDGDFLSVDPYGMDDPRKPDGSLPDLTFMHLAPGSDLINAGVDVGFPFKGAKPDLGCFETDESTGISLLPKNWNNLFDLQFKTTETSVEISFNPSGETSFNSELISIKGMVVWSSREYLAGGGRNRITIDRTGMTAGIYLIRLTSGNRMASAKLILP